MWRISWLPLFLWIFVYLFLFPVYMSPFLGCVRWRSGMSLLFLFQQLGQLAQFEFDSGILIWIKSRSGRTYHENRVGSIHENRVRWPSRVESGSSLLGSSFSSIIYHYLDQWLVGGNGSIRVTAEGNGRDRALATVVSPSATLLMVMKKDEAR